MNIELILQDIADYQQELSENDLLPQQIKACLAALQEKLKAMPESTTDEQICDEIETTSDAIDCIYEELHQNPPDLFTAPGTEDGITYEQRVAALMARLNLHQENKKLCECALNFLKALEQIDLTPSEEQKSEPEVNLPKEEKIEPEVNLPKEEKTEKIALVNIKKIDKALHEDTKRWLESTKHLSFLGSHTSLTLARRKKQAPVTANFQMRRVVTPVQRPKLTSV